MPTFKANSQVTASKATTKKATTKKTAPTKAEANKTPKVTQFKDANPEEVNVGDVLVEGDMEMTVLNNNFKTEPPKEEKPKTTKKAPAKKTTTTDKEEKPKKTTRKTSTKKATETKEEKPKTTTRKTTTKKTPAKKKEEKEETEAVVMQVGNPLNYFYYKILFTSASPDADILAMCVKDGAGNIFYAENVQCDVTKMDSDVFASVFKNLISVKDRSATTKTEGNKWCVIGNEDHIAMQFMLWLTDKNFSDIHKRVQFVGDRCALEHIRLLKMLSPKGSETIEIPDAVSPISYELNQEISRILTFPKNPEVSDKDWDRLFVPDIETYYINRSELVERLGIEVEHDEIYAINEVNNIEALFKWIWNL